MEETEPTYLTVQPGGVDLGVNYVGARVSGSFQAIPATRCEGLTMREWPPKPDGGPPEWLHLSGPQPTGQRGLAWDFEIDTSRPGRLNAMLEIECDTGRAFWSVNLTVSQGPAALGDIVLCGSPFNCHTTWDSVRSLVRILRWLPARVHCELPADPGPVPRTLLLHGGGLLACHGRGDFDRIRSLVEAGMRLVVLGDTFYVGTLEAANDLLAPWGMEIQDLADNPPPGVDAGEDDTAVSEDVCEHELTAGVRRTRWFRYCTIPESCSGLQPLIRNPLNPGHCFAAAGGPGGRVVAIGTSLWCSLSQVGWPFDNDRLLANLLVGGDAEAARAR